VAVEKNDPLAVDLFKSAGQALGRHIKALIPKADQVIHVSL